MAFAHDTRMKSVGATARLVRTLDRMLPRAKRGDPPPPQLPLDMDPSDEEEPPEAAAEPDEAPAEEEPPPPEPPEPPEPLDGEEPPPEPPDEKKPPRCAPRVRTDTLVDAATWLDDALSLDGVAACFEKKLMQLNPKCAAGRADFWIQQLRGTSFAEERVLTHEGLVSQSKGVPNFFPLDAEGAKLYAMDTELEFAEESAAGFAVEVRTVAPPLKGDGARLRDFPFLLERLRLRLLASKLGIAPPVFALFVGRRSDDVPGAAGSRIAAVVVVEKRHSFSLHEMLTANETRDDTSSMNLSESVGQAAFTMARQLRKLAKHRILKVAPEEMVFCPELDPADEGNMQSHGHKIDKERAGYPFVANFDPLTTHEFTKLESDYNEDAAYFVMILQLLSHARGHHGLKSYQILRNVLLGRDTAGASRDESDLPADFDELGLLRVSARIEAAAEAFSQLCARVFSLAHGSTVLLDVIDDVARSGVSRKAAEEATKFLRTSAAVAGRSAPVVEHASLATRLESVRAQSRIEKWSRVQELAVEG